jgi:hypothetical protein
MSKRIIGLVLSLIVSVGIGVLAAQKFFVLFDKTVPAGSMTDLVACRNLAGYLSSESCSACHFRGVRGGGGCERGDGGGVRG